MHRLIHRLHPSHHRDLSSLDISTSHRHHIDILLRLPLADIPFFRIAIALVFRLVSRLLIVFFSFSSSRLLAFICLVFASTHRIARLLFSCPSKRSIATQRHNLIYLVRPLRLLSPVFCLRLVLRPRFVLVCPLLSLSRNASCAPSFDYLFTRSALLRHVQHSCTAFLHLIVSSRLTIPRTSHFTTASLISNLHSSYSHIATSPAPMSRRSI